MYLNRAHGINEDSELRPVGGGGNVCKPLISLQVSFSILLCPGLAFVFLHLRTCTLDCLWRTPWGLLGLLCLPIQKAGSVREFTSCQGCSRPMGGRFWKHSTLPCVWTNLLFASRLKSAFSQEYVLNVNLHMDSCLSLILGTWYKSHW